MWLFRYWDEEGSKPSGRRSVAELATVIRPPAVPGACRRHAAGVLIAGLHRGEDEGRIRRGAAITAAARERHGEDGGQTSGAFHRHLRLRNRYTTRSQFDLDVKEPKGRVFPPPTGSRLSAGRGPHAHQQRGY